MKILIERINFETKFLESQAFQANEEEERKLGIPGQRGFVIA
jgi:hypothetical protein